MTAGSSDASKASTPQVPLEGERSTLQSAASKYGEVSNIAMKCVLKADVERFVKCFEDDEDPYHDSVVGMVNERDDDGRTPLDMAAILGRAEMIRELINRGAEVNKPTQSGMDIQNSPAL